MKKFKVTIFILAMAAACYFAPGKLNTRKDQYKCSDCNVILISLDTLRADHLGCYGYNKNTSPNIDKFCDDSVVFNTAISQAPSTAPSHGSMLTSLIPSAHGAFFSRKTPISSEVPTAAEILKQSGYSTVSFNGGGQIAATFGFARGFDIYTSFNEPDYVNEFFKDRALLAKNWIMSRPSGKFFLFLHSYEVHHPYSPKDEFLDQEALSYKGNLPRNVRGTLLRDINRDKVKINDQDRKYIESLYDAEIRSVDRAFGEFISFLKSENIYDKSIIVLTSDHGEEFNEHGKIGWHSHTLFDELLKVPLIIKLPGSAYAGYSVDNQVRSIDILPTILDTLDIPAPQHFHGRTLSGLFAGKGEFDQFAVSQKDSKNPATSSSLRTHEWKLIRAKLYDLKNDPKEQENAAAANQPVAEAFSKKLESLVNIDTKEGSESQMDIDPATQEQLRTLGYIN